MDETELNYIVEAWIAGEAAERGSPEYESNRCATDVVVCWGIDGEGDLLWQFIRAAYTRDLPDKVIASLAAGPVEDLLVKRGVGFIDQVEELARKDPKFNYLLGGVWRSSMPEEVWRRVQAIRNHIW